MFRYLSKEEYVEDGEVEYLSRGGGRLKILEKVMWYFRLPRFAFELKPGKGTVKDQAADSICKRRMIYEDYIESGQDRRHRSRFHHVDFPHWMAGRSCHCQLC